MKKKQMSERESFPLKKRRKVIGETSLTWAIKAIFSSPKALLSKLEKI